MILLPYERFTIQTPLTPDQVRQKLSIQMEEAHATLSWTPLASNQGDGGVVRIYKFETHPTSYWKRRRSKIKGKVSYEMGITKIEVTMLLEEFMLIFTVLMFAFLGFIWFLFFREWVISIGTPQMFFPKHVLGIGGALILGYAIFIGAVKLEAAMIEDSLRSTLDATEK